MFVKPLVSIIMTAYNCEKYIAEAIESILMQSYRPLELIVVNDGSQDQTQNILHQFHGKIRWVAQSNLGQPIAMNRGISLAQGSLIGFLDADDLYSEEKIALQVDYLIQKPDLDVVFGYVKQFYSPDLPLWMRKKWACPSQSSIAYLAATGLFRKSCFNQVGVFNEDQKIGIFIEWYMRAQEKGLRHEYLDKVVLQRRIHASNMGIEAHASRHEYLKIVKNALKRRSQRVVS